MRKTVAILGIPIDDLDFSQAMARIEEFIRSGRFHQVATANTDFLIKAQGDPELKTILRDADMVVADGMPLVMASRWLHAGLRERVTGSDMVPRLAKLAAEKGYRFFMLGAKPEVAQKAKERLVAENPGLQVVGCVSPPPSSIVEMDNEFLLAGIEAARPDILLVAFGNPKQEKWIHMHRHRLRVPVCIGVGGTFDFLAGTLVRAPEWMQRSGLEWLHRLLQEPRRMWRRYGADFVYFGRFIAAQLWAMRRTRWVAHPRIAAARAGDCTVISVVGPLGARLLAEFQQAAEQALDVPTHLVLDLRRTTQVDSAALGTLLNLRKRAAYVGREVRMADPSRRVRRVLGTSHAEDAAKRYATLADALRGDAPERLDVRLTVQEGLAVLTLSGRADADAVPCMEATLRDLPPTVQNVDIVMRGVSYVDCAMLAALRRFADNLNRTGGRARLLPGDAVQRALAREKLTQVFEVIDREV
jgi:N-acetylglucosaminyldiphosphoundecaprenol N-acetyl-beta-D-mannosaminyltransferase